jgi:hypothetical protein
MPRSVSTTFFVLNSNLIEYIILKRSLRQRITLGNTLDLNSLNDQDFLTFFRFDKSQLNIIIQEFKLPQVFFLSNRLKIDCRTALCVVLRRLTYPNRFADLCVFFGRPESNLSRIFNEIIGYLFEKFKVLFEWDYQRLNPAKLQEFSERISSKGAPLTDCIGFIDGTVRPICRPGKNQKAVYNGHKRVHSLKYQSVTSPEGLIIHLFGPIEGARHDSFLLAESGLREKIELHCCINSIQKYLYGDPAYGLKSWLQCPISNPNSAQEHSFNRKMSCVRVTVEYGFQRIVTYFPYLDFKKSQKILLQPIGKYYFIGALFANIHGILNNGTQTSKYFDIEMPTLKEYLNSAFNDNL